VRLILLAINGAISSPVLRRRPHVDMCPVSERDFDRDTICVGTATSILETGAARPAGRPDT
jgi:hypothetical protein